MRGQQIARPIRLGGLITAVANLVITWAGQVCRRIETKLFIWGIFLSVAAAILVVIVMLALGEYTQTRGRLILTALLMAGFGLAGLGPAALAQRGSWPALWSSGLLAALVGVALLIGGVWGAPESNGYWKAAAIMTVLGFSLAYASWAMWLGPLSTLVRRVSRMSAALALLAGVVACLGIGSELKAPSYQWAITVLILAWIGAALAIPALALAAKVLRKRRD